jgi:outer membrane protein assembly factor BamD (BamD/ComL family)
MGANPAEALRALEEHRARFPQGTFAQEREVLAIEALVRLGRRAEAEARAAAFARQFPGSAHRRRIAVLLAVDGGPQ